MRKSDCSQWRLDCLPIEELKLNFECRDEIIPILAGLQHVYDNVTLRELLINWIASDVNENTRSDVGREGLNYWQILVIATVRLGCNLNYDKLQDLCENHRSLRCLLGIGEWDTKTSFGWRRLQDTICRLKPETIKQINAALATYGQELHGSSAEYVRADSFVVETDIHYPTESSLIWDGMRKILKLSVKLSEMIGASGWRQAAHLQSRIKEHVREISRISASESPAVKEGLNDAYKRLLDRSGAVLGRARALKIQAEEEGSCCQSLVLAKELQDWIELTTQVCDTAFRRTQLGEEVCNDDKLFSLFEQHTQLYRRGKAGEPNQFGRLALIFEDGAGFISHYKLLHRKAQDAEVVVDETREAQRIHGNQIKRASFDRGFHSPENEVQLSAIIEEPCLPPRHRNQYAERLKTATISFRQARQHHSGVESAIGALQSGNGLKRCRDRSELGFERYLALAILGRNFHVLGKLLISREAANSEAARSLRAA